MDSSILAELYQTFLPPQGMQLHLVDCWDDLGEGQELSEEGDVEIADSDGSNKASVHQLLHSPPRVLDARQEIARRGRGRARRVGGVTDVSGVDWRGPVEKEEVKVEEAEVVEGGFGGLLDTLGEVVAKQDFGADEDVFTEEAAVWAERIRQREPHLRLVAVQVRAVEVAVARLQRGTHRLSANIPLRLPSAKPNGRDGGAGVEREMVRHAPIRLHGGDVQGPN